MATQITSKEEILELHKQNPELSLSELGAMLGISRQRVHQVLQKHGIKKQRKARPWKYYCSICSKPVSHYATICRPCYFKRKARSKVWLTCSNCGRAFQRYDNKIPLNPYCSKECLYSRGDELKEFILAHPDWTDISVAEHTGYTRHWVNMVRHSLIEEGHDELRRRV